MPIFIRIVDAVCNWKISIDFFKMLGYPARCSKNKKTRGEEHA